MEQRKTADREPELLELQDSLDQYTFGKETMDVKKIKEIVSRMDEILGENPQEFQKEEVWSRICAACSEETAAEDADTRKSGDLHNMELSAEFGAESLELPEKSGGDAEAEKATGRRAGGKGIFRITGRKKRYFHVGIAASVIMIAVFIGANIGTYATQKKNVFEVVDERKNGTAFWGSGDVQMLETDYEEQAFYSWNKVPNEYRDLLLIPYGMPDQLNLYQIIISKINTLNWIQIRYLDDSGKKNFDIQIVDYQVNEFAFQDLLLEETEYTLLKEEAVNGIVVKYYEDRDNDYVALFTDNVQWFTFYTNLSYEEFKNIVCKTIENNF